MRVSGGVNQVESWRHLLVVEALPLVALERVVSLVLRRFYLEVRDLHLLHVLRRGASLDRQGVKVELLHWREQSRRLAGFLNSIDGRGHDLVFLPTA